ncbi:hypothetical protein MKW98_006062 [Papaver atlanticum]|uniref:Aerolysin-like C-terminal domain-containing protein n=1 Tax=Papaver atlanticum TaxID=357466 RepID=A0AAD4XXF2_9MAGN|nr:hypothetical protein MKW98_006062 [Papaver atlanticum]
MAAIPEENHSDIHCTLFQPVFVYSNSNRVARLRHVNTGNFVRKNNSNSGTHDVFGCLTLLPKLQTDNETVDVCTFIDWESVVVLPDLIRIKGDGGHHLKASGGDGYMDYWNKPDNSTKFDYEVSPSRNGGVRLKSVYYGTYWTDMDDSIWVLLKRVSSPTVHDINTVFFPAILGGNRIIMRSLKTNKYCKLYTDHKITSCLATHLIYPDEYSNMDIEEPIISKKINNVIYHLNDARIYNDKTSALITDDSSNGTCLPQTSQMNFKTIVSNTTSWSTSRSFKVGITGTFGLPFIKSGSLDISGEFNKSWNEGDTHTESTEVGSVWTVTVPPTSRVKTSLMATRCSYDIPFSYTQDVILKNGTTRVTKKNDGLITGQIGYGYKLEAVQLPLDILTARSSSSYNYMVNELPRE